MIHHSREHVSTALESSGSMLYTTAFRALYCTWSSCTDPTVSFCVATTLWLSCCCSQLLPLCYNTTNSLTPPESDPFFHKCL
ncbi:unnamed protein product [Staurois parvus]|uniref:Uncharacterized protein n=1 Tax=Staurois parvus TaxID=386267 RepID=A0ABN9H0D6_9NEOB|nr:unnamed protein product [Staurois parvus]